MPSNMDGRAVTVSVKIYERLLATYPTDFRREYGPAMKQLFRDQCRDAWSAGRGRGLAVLWLRVLLDWAKTSVVQHLLNLHKKESTCMKIVRAFRADVRPRAAFIRVFAVVFLLSVMTSTLLTILSPKQYFSMAQIKVHNDQPEEVIAKTDQPTLSTDPYFLVTQRKIIESHRILTNDQPKKVIAKTDQPMLSPEPYFLVTQSKIIESHRILTNVIVNLHLDEKLATQNGTKRWSVDQTYDYLLPRLSLEQTRMASLIEISVRNQSPELAASIANAVADSYKEFRIEMWKNSHLQGIKALEEKQASMTNELLQAEKKQLARILNREIAEVGQPNQGMVTVSNPARPDVNSVVPTKWRLFSMWILGGTLLAAVAGGGSAWRTRQSSAR
ncbi:MAG TPA: hypothetical protein VGR14_06245 [Verrucomicrobiae bacterium]|jgi:capsular polysaccharide biosynthesis protein|nr:hypothetical protein [Verrucomicrobiae bacterium]